MNEQHQLPTRDQVPSELKWDLTLLYPNDQTMQAQLSATVKRAQTVHELAGALARNNGQTLLKALQMIKQINEELEREYVYAFLRRDSDTTNAQATELYGEAATAATKIETALSFMDPEIVAIPKEKLDRWLTKIPQLAEFKFALQQIRLQKGHVLTANEEQLVSQLSRSLDSAETIYNTLNDADLHFGKIKDEHGNWVELTHGNRSQFTESLDREVRKAATMAYQKPYHELRNTFAATLNNFIDSRNSLAELRHYQSARQAALSVNQIDEQVYDTLVNKVNQHLDLAHRWYSIKKRALHLDPFYQYDIGVPLAGRDRLRTTFQQGKQMVLQAMQIMGPDYLKGLHEEFDHRWIDAAENRGKRSGGYQVSVYQANPFILLNWTDKLYSTFVLAHESGHAMHSWFSQHVQPSEYADAPIFLAEVASTFNENILTEYLLDKYQDDRQLQIFILEQSINGFIGSIYRQTQFAEFENTAYREQQAGRTLTADYLDQMNRQLVEKYYGPAVKLVGTDTQAWAYVPHFYMNYYVYQYATSWAIATTLSEQVWTKQSGALERYLAFLKAGGSADPITILKNAGVDVTNGQYLEDALHVFAQRLDQIEALLSDE
ncbi:oligoendopeptidase F [uncultured Limosilactobacillus sp.]|uniref:oligoendopeptidase F n=1 Tax=uncultured Limosilactobacillus sp. TaxID=2837629 RepID=UPI0025F8937A|nr:oligoendopeptidase F [uncultured Limosilactobacillus sp.]